MKNILLCYKRCTTCKNVEKLLDEKGFEYEIREITDNNPTKDELREWIKISGLPIKRFFNTSGKIYREMGLSKKLKDMSEEEQIELLSTDGMIVKRPILLSGDKVIVGPDVKKFAEEL